ncbi:MAG: hydroxyacid dehydrogenase [Betaproteobacteria bacterium]|nr:hydroxyacid dehydrogenase [Betaproteobacteria bacterium]MDH4324516.1 hydroxyacid dehydrogenase [Betaproteobacteria bacterium]MDH5211584.1 hydroxyacid dehydrogenase [Betaproteobacteria bacterium]
MMRVLLTDPIDESGEALLRARGAEVVRAPEGSAATVKRLAADADGVIIRSKLPEDIFEAAPRVRAVTIHGTGIDLVPLAAASAKGVLVANLPGSNAQSVAEYCVLAMLMLARNIAAINAAMHTQPWDEARRLAMPAREITGLTVGIVGVGEIGRRVAQICARGFGMRVLGHQRRLDRLPPEAQGTDLDNLVAQSDFIVIACPLNPQTHHLFNAARLAAMKSSAWLINVGRGPVIDETALIDALQNRRIAGAMLDVYEHYRIEPGHPLLALDNVLLTPHLAGSTRESRARASVRAADETLRMLAGEKPSNLVNPEAWHVRRPENR